MSKYSLWISKQEKDFRLEVCGHDYYDEAFYDSNFKAISLEELEQLDKTFIFREAVLSDQQGGAQESK